ncbi:hypothetical protein E2C01_030670 [Portunus trituberculatus]|uniref:Uncharacterized protein n=1 Tax=Portunus trituberculatus TaxID=210409 RepID=A0A5B7EVH7_PORTR|nr:hypothetical protein [Portunus trituberculatus]
MNQNLLKLLSLHHELCRKQSALINTQLENEVIKKKVLLAQLEEAQARVRLAELEVAMPQKREELNQKCDE